MKDKQTLFDVTVNILERIRDVLMEVTPDVVLVHYDEKIVRERVERVYVSENNELKTKCK